MNNSAITVNNDLQPMLRSAHAGVNVVLPEWLVDCSKPCHVCVQGFRQWFLGTLDIPSQAADRRGLPVRVTFISRKPYGKKRKLTRQISNEDDLFAMVQSMPGVQAYKADFAQISLADQLHLVATDTDVLVGESAL